MGDRRLRVAPHFPKLTISTMHLWSLPTWILVSLTANCFLLLLLLVNLREQPDAVSVANSALATQPEATQANLTTVSPLVSPEPATVSLGERHQLSYEQWVGLLEQEAKVAAEQNPEHLTVLAGDSISLWFPHDLLPAGRTWLNQGISGETSAGLLDRLPLFDDTSPEAIFVMIGINDLIHGVPNTEILENQQQIIRYLKEYHPRSHIVVQSILPHAGEKATWEGRDRLKAIPNTRIRSLNADLEELAAAEAVYYLDLYSLFADAEGNLQTTLSTDGLHLNSQGYLVWRTALQLYSKMQWGAED
jgi:lysophospholipase L1-like esterase